MSNTVPTCTTGKVGFAHERAALRAGAQMRRHGGKPAPMFAYECATCGEWHQTQQSPQTHRLRRARAAQHTGHRKAEFNE